MLWSTSALSWGSTGSRLSSCVRVQVRQGFTRCAAQPASKGVATDRLRVKLLEDMNGVGKKGEITTVSRTMWLNVLQPRKRAVEVTDTQLKQLETDKISSAQKHKDELVALAEAIRNLSTLRVQRKTGPNQKMFGSVTSNNILEVVKSALPSRFDRLLKSKSVGIVSIAEGAAEGGQARKAEHSAGTDIRSCGVYTITLSLEHDFPPVQFSLHVVPQVS